jgi:hypothetical protein
VKVIALTNCENYVKEEVLRVAGKKTETDINNLGIDDKTTIFNYFDGLGRGVQTVVVKGSFAKSDIVQPVKYDQYGRQEFAYLPYSIASSKPGSMRPDPFTEQTSFYTNQADVPHDLAYAKTVFEASPLNRIKEQGAPGAHWQPGGKTVKFNYEINVTNEVIRWSLDANGYPVVNTSALYFPANSLFKNVTTDEHGNKVIEYKNSRDQVLLKKVQEAATPQTLHTGWLCTYYVYDDFDQLRIVIPPQAVHEMGTNYAIAKTAAFVDKWLFVYKYDYRRRMVSKQVPGAKPVLMIYDKWDRLVLVQDGNQRTKNEWHFTKYDQLNRPIITGITTIADATNLESNVHNQTNRFENTASGGVAYTLNRTYPTNATEAQCRTISYYDNYAFPFAAVATFKYVPDNGLGTTFNTSLKGHLTGSMVKNLTTNTWLKSIIYYDQYLRPVQAINETHLGGFQRTSTTYDFTGNVLQNRAVYSEPGQKQLALDDQFSYDHGNRLLAQKEVLAREVSLTELTGVSLSGTVLTKTAATGWGTGGAATTDKIPAGQYGFIEATASETNTARMFGLSAANTNAHYNTINFCPIHGSQRRAQSV